MTGEELKEFRESKGLTQSDLAKRINKSLRTIQNWEASKNEIPYKAAYLIRESFSNKNVVKEEGIEYNTNLNILKDGVEFSSLEIVQFVINNYKELSIKHDKLKDFIELKTAKRLAEITMNIDSVKKFLNEQ